MKLFKTIPSLILLLLSGYTYAQLPQPVGFYAKQYPNDDILTVQELVEISITLEKDGIKIITRNESQDLLLNDKAALGIFGEQKVWYSSGLESLIDIDAYTLNPKGDKGYTKLKVENFETETSNSQGVFYDDVKSINLRYAGIQKGSIRNLNYAVESSNPFMLHGHYFKNYSPVQNSLFRIIYPEDLVGVSFRSFGDFENIEFRERKKGKNKIIEWEASKLSAIERERMAPGFKYLSPNVQVMINHYIENGEKIEVLKDTDHLFRYYNSLVKDLDMSLPSELLKITENLTKGKSEIEKIRSIYYWVQDNIHYVAFEDGMAGFIPRIPKTVFDKKYGDCKDMASIIVAMLQHANIDGKLAWIGTRTIPFTYTENPTLSVDNHMIAAVKYQDKWVFLDATDYRNDLFIPTEHIIGKEAMIRLSSNAYEIVKVPINRAEDNFQKSTYDIQINGKNLDVKLLSVFEGYWKNDVKHNVIHLSEKEKIDHIKQNMPVGNNKTEYPSLQFLNEKTREAPLEIQSKAIVKDYIKELGGELYVNLNLSALSIAHLEIQKDRKLPLVLQYPFLQENEYILEIPENYEVSYVPENISVEMPDLKYSIDYKVEGNAVIAKHRLASNLMEVKPSDFEQWNDLIKKMNAASRELLGLKQK